MIQFGNIIIEGFCSIPYLELNLGLRGITVIRGATGEGKTTILSALVWAVYGKNIKVSQMLIPGRNTGKRIIKVQR